jgi:surface antigen
VVEGEGDRPREVAAVVVVVESDRRAVAVAVHWRLHYWEVARTVEGDVFDRTYSSTYQAAEVELLTAGESRDWSFGVVAREAAVEEVKGQHCRGEDREAAAVDL